jgi:RecJ-like exonuclease
MRNPFIQGLERIKKEENEIIIFSDMGSGQIETIEQFNCKVIIIDHHQVHKSKTRDNILQINANLCGINGNYEASGASLSFSIAKALNKTNIDLAPLAIAGATGDKQYIGNIRGYNKTILEDALKNGFLKKYTGIKLYGETLFDALYYSIDPFYAGISGNKDAIYELLEQLHLDKKAKIEDLNDQQIKRLQSFLIFELIKKGCEKDIIDTVIRKRYWSEALKCELERYADLLDACGKGGNRGLGLAVCLGDQNFFNKAVKLEKDYKQKILDELLKLEEEGVIEKKYFRYFYSKRSSLGGVIGGIATNFILDKKKPLFSLVRKDDEIHISCRGNQFLVNNGLDLGSAMKKIATILDGNGGGHKIAAGATINSNKEKDFLDKANTIISKQMKV